MKLKGVNIFTDTGLLSYKLRKSRYMSENNLKQCLVCGTEKPADQIKIFMTLDMCSDCIDKEKAMQANIIATADERVKEMGKNLLNAHIANAAKKDDAIHYNSDIFNAATVSIAELETVINLDANITPDQKYFALAKEVTDRIGKFSQRLFDLKTETDNVKTEQIVHQRKLNELADKLSQAEREKLKIIAINYKPQLTKKPQGVKAPKLVKKSENYAAVLRDYPHISLEDAKLASQYMDLLNRRGKVVTTGDAIAYLKEVG